MTFPRWKGLSSLLVVVAAAAAIVVNLVDGATQRTRHVDVFDADTLQYYIQDAPRADYDLVVLYYAPWCTNCRALAPIYEKMAGMLRAGTSSSHLLVGYFNCEADKDHAALCNTVRITHYPTIHFYSLSGQSLSRRPPRHIIPFEGNWQYGDAILDWIKSMSFLSQWHRAAWGQRLRGLVLGRPVQSRHNESLPIGIPEPVASQRKAAQLQEQAKKTREMAVRSSFFIDALLEPMSRHDRVTTLYSDGHHTYPDLFAYLTANNLWKATDPFSSVTRACVMEAALDICDRLSLRVTKDWLNERPIDQLSNDDWDKFDNITQNAVEKAEPYCIIVESCVLNDYKAMNCQPKACPFVDPVGCRYITACLTESLQQEYATALQLNYKDTVTTTKKAAVTSKKPKAFGVV